MELVEAVKQYGFDGIITRSEYNGDHCTRYFKIRERGYSEHLLAKLYHLLMENYSDVKLRRLFMKIFMGGFVPSTDNNDW